MTISFYFFFTNAIPPTRIGVCMHRYRTRRRLVVIIKYIHNASTVDGEGGEALERERGIDRVRERADQSANTAVGTATFFFFYISSDITDG